MAQNDSQEKTEQATPKRLRESRRKGEIPRSRELNAMAVMLCGSAALIFFGPSFVEAGFAMMRERLMPDAASIADPTALPRIFALSVRDALLVITPFLGVCLVSAMAAPVLLGGWSFSLDAISFKFEKLNPVKGLSRVFALRSLVELVKALAKFVLVGAAAVALLLGLADELLGLGREPLKKAVVHGVGLAVWSLLQMSAVLILIAAVDVPFQLWEHAKKMRMSKQEIRDESKETEGRPEVKARIRQTQQEMSRRRMMEEVPKADVIVTNPTHYAVALRYEQDRDGAPRVVAKGADLMAAQIRSIARAHDIPLFEAPPLARALHATCELGQQIPAALYVAVAQVLTYVYQLRQAVSNGDAPPPVPEVGLDATAPGLTA